MLRRKIINCCNQKIKRSSELREKIVVSIKYIIFKFPLDTNNFQKEKKNQKYRLN